MSYSFDWPSTLNYLFGLVTIASASFAVWSHVINIRKRIPAFHIDPFPSQIIRGDGQVQDLQISFRGEPLEKLWVLSTTVYFWNGGRESIREGHVLRPLMIQLQPEARLLTWNIAAGSREVCGISLLATDTPNALKLHFDILEYMDGARIQLIYAAEGRTDITVSGTVEDANEPLVVGITPRTLSVLPFWINMLAIGSIFYTFQSGYLHRFRPWIIVGSLTMMLLFHSINRYQSRRDAIPRSIYP